MNPIKTLLAEAADNVPVAGCIMFFFIAFIAAIAEPVASLLPLALGVGCYLLAYFKDQQ